MHEFSMMQRILEAVLGAAKQHGAERVLEINLKIGALTFLNPEQLRFAFSILSEGTIAEDANLRIETVRPRIRCSSCGYEGLIEYDGPEYHLLSMALSMKCVRCGSAEVEITAGRECSVKDMRIKIP